MKTLRFSFIFLLVLVIGFQASARVLFIDPKFENTVPVYGVDKNGKVTEELTSLVPGDFVSVDSDTPKTIGGKKYFIIKGKNAMGQDIQLALSAESLNWPDNSALYRAADNAKKIKVEGKGSVLSTNAPGQDKSACSIAKEMGDPDLCHDVKPGSDIEVDDAVLALTTDGESPKEKWRSYVKGKDGYWTDSENTTRVDDSFSMIAPGVKGVECETKTATDELPALTDGLNQAAMDDQLKLIMENIGDCYPYTEAGAYHDTVIDGVAKKPLGVLYKEMKLDGAVQVVNATRADWVSIDVLARTLYGEMASCFKKGHEYPQTVAKVVLNRVDFKNDIPGAGKRFIDQDSDPSRRNNITNAIFKSKQFSIWNRNEKARKMAMCPPSSSEKKFWNGNTPGEDEVQIWKDAVRIASQAVLQGESFRKDTKDLKALYYTSDFELSKKDYNVLTKETISGKKLPLGRCVQLWSEKKLKEDYPEYGIFHPLFQKALLPVASF